MGKKKKRSAKKTSSTNAKKQQKQDSNSNVGNQSKIKKNTNKTHRPPAIGEYRPDNSSIRLDWLLNLSAFFFVGVGIVVIYGGWFIARTYLPQVNATLIAKHNDIIIKGLLYGSLLFATGIFFKLYALIHTINLKQRLKGIQPPEGEWFLKLAILLLAGASCTILTTGFVKQHLLHYTTPEHAQFAIAYLATYLKRCILSGSFFLLLAIFTQVYLLTLKLSEECE